MEASTAQRVKRDDVRVAKAESLVTPCVVVQIAVIRELWLLQLTGGSNKPCKACWGFESFVSLTTRIPDFLLLLLLQTYHF